DGIRDDLVTGVQTCALPILDVEVLILADLPPAVGPLEDKAADGVAGAPLAPALLVDLLPLRELDLGLRGSVLVAGARVERVGARSEERRVGNEGGGCVAASG